MTAPNSARLIESWFPSVQLSLLVIADRRSRDPVYGLHRWFARRPPTLVRGLLLASHLAFDHSAADFWRMHQTSGPWLADAHVYDPFMGGGTSLVEAARMSASVHGRDVDPLACLLVSGELDPPPVDELLQSAGELMGHLASEVGELFHDGQGAWIPLHWFWLRRVRCQECAAASLVYRDLILARDTRRAGSVVRDTDIHAFCPDCLQVHELNAARKTLTCCGRRRNLYEGSFTAGKFRCGQCSATSSLEGLQPGRAERVLVAVEETHRVLRRRIRSATPADLKRTGDLDREGESRYDRQLEPSRRDPRPVSLGFSRSRDLFSERQWRLFTAGFEWIDESNQPDRMKRALRLALSSILPSNNLLCGYARDYGRLAPLFSVRGFSVPTLSVELNPLHPTAGRGTVSAAIRRLSNLKSTAVQRYEIRETGVAKSRLDLPVNPQLVDIACASAEDSDPQASLRADVCVTDPPYFDYIAYSELSEFFRVWLPEPTLGGAPLLPEAEDSINSFSDRLAAVLKVTMTKLQPDTPIVFTYHSRHTAAWEAIGSALDDSGLVLTALWPVVADPQMGHHSGDGNCEWDVVLVCRPQAEDMSAKSVPTMDEWTAQAEANGLRLNSADRESLSKALRMAHERYFAPAAP